MNLHLVHAVFVFEIDDKKTTLKAYSVRWLELSNGRYSIQVLTNKVARFETDTPPSIESARQYLQNELNK